MIEHKPKFTANLMSFCAIIFGLISSFGGIDITVLATLIGVIGVFVVLIRRDLGGFLKANSASYLLFFALGLLVIFMLMGHFSVRENITETVKNLVANLILLPFVIYVLSPSGADNKLISRAIFAGFILGLSLLCIEAIDNYYMFRLANPDQVQKALEVNLGRGAYIIIAMYWPAMLAAQSLGIEKKYQVFIFIATAFLGTRFGIDLNIAIFLIANFAALIALKFPRIIIGLVFLTSGILVAFAPIIYGKIAHLAKNLFGQNMPLSYERRADMWLYAIDRIKEKPIWGHGLDKSREFGETVHLGGYDWPAIQMHPHSAPLHIWLEGGAIGASLVLFILAICAYLALRTKKLNTSNSWAFTGLLTSILCVWALSHAIWEQWLWSVSAILFCFVFALKYKKQINKDLEEI